MNIRLKKVMSASIALVGTIFSGSAWPQSADALLSMSISDAAKSMQRPHEAEPNGVPAGYSWQAGPVIQAGDRIPPTFHAIIGWGQIFLVKGVKPVAASITIRSVKTYIVTSSGSIQLIQPSTTVDGSNFSADYENNVNSAAQLITSAFTGTTVTTNPNAAFHFWPHAGKVSIDPNDVKGVIVAIEARLNPVNGRSNADVQNKYVLSAGADYWAATNSTWDNYKSSAGVGVGRFEYVTTDWKCFTMTTLTARDTAQLGKSFAC